MIGSFVRLIAYNQGLRVSKSLPRSSMFAILLVFFLWTCLPAAASDIASSSNSHAEASTSGDHAESSNARARHDSFDEFDFEAIRNAQEEADRARLEEAQRVAEIEHLRQLRHHKLFNNVRWKYDNTLQVCETIIPDSRHVLDRSHVYGFHQFHRFDFSCYKDGVRYQYSLVCVREHERGWIDEHRVGWCNPYRNPVWARSGIAPSETQLKARDHEILRYGQYRWEEPSEAFLGDPTYESAPESDVDDQVHHDAGGEEVVSTALTAFLEWVDDPAHLAWRAPRQA
ncbi:hypothetical protein MRB53_039611 [Persea americana]|nr:hypothetical protein MRB53_039611 [Persea americana]